MLEMQFDELRTWFAAGEKQLAMQSISLIGS
jgi:hypothetical protein